MSYIDNIYPYYGYAYFLDPDGDYMTVTVEKEDGEKLELDSFSSYESVDYCYVSKSTEAEIAEGYDQYYTYLYLVGYIGDSEMVDMNVWFSYNLTTTGVANVEASENAPVEYFNLQGVKVAEPSNGIFIRRQGNKTSKIAIK